MHHFDVILEGPWQQGKTAKFKSITEIKDADTVNLERLTVGRHII
jgi:hypothetical protein